MSITLTTLQGRLGRRLKDINDVTNSRLYDNATDLNQFLYEEMCSVDPDRFLSSSTYTVSTSPSTQALPTDLNDLFRYGAGFYVRNSAGADTKTKLVPTSFGSTAPGYYLLADNVVFTGINTSTTIILKYIPTLADITTLAGTFCVPDRYKELLEEGLVKYYYRDEEDPRESEADQRFARLLSQFLQNIKKTPRVYSVSNPNFGA